MSNTYVKKYDVGQIKLDLPYANYIHELPLLSFGDVQHTINLSLVFNYARKHDGDCSFYIAEGFKLNLQKRIGFDACAGTPLEFIESNGKCISLSKNGDIYTFRDESQRILRKNGSTYEVEYPDFSKEVYNNHGYITVAYDKYGTEVLTYTYEDDRLTNISYRGSKDIVLGYNSSDQLASITYAGCSINFNYNDDRSLNFIKHYSEVYYTFDFSNRYKVFIGDGVGSGAKTVTVATDTTNKTITVSDHNADSTVYKFYDSINPARYSRIVDITDKNGVKTRVQFENEKPVYQYEIIGDEHNDNFLQDAYGNYNIYKSTVYMNKDKTTGKLGIGDGMRMSGDSHNWTKIITGSDSLYGNFIISGWLYPRAETTFHISVEDIWNDENEEQNFTVTNLTPEIWNYFSFSVYLRNPEYISIGISCPDDVAVFCRDMRMTFAEGKVYGTSEISHFMQTKDVLIDESSNKCLSLETDCKFYNGNVLLSGNFTSKDILRYKLNQMYGSQQHIIFYDECKKAIPYAGAFSVRYTEGGTTYSVPITDIGVGTKRINDGNEYITKCNLYQNSNGGYEFVSTSYVNGTRYKEERYNAKLDLISSMTDGITTEYERNAQGLVERESIAGLYRQDTTYTDALITVKDVDPSTGAVNSTTKYHINSTWGNVEKVEMPDGSVITDTYDGDMSVLMNKAFDSSETRKNVFGYSNGRLASITGGALSYYFVYTNKNRLESVSKNDDGVEHHIYSDDGTTVVSKYPNADDTLHTETKVFDKYGRLEGVNGVIANVYDISPSFNSSTGELIVSGDCGSSRLAMSTDLLRGETTRYKYNGSGAVSEVTVTDSDDFANKASTETFEYDALGRVTKDDFTYDPTAEDSVTSDVEYATDEDNPLADNRASSYSFKVNGVEKAQTANEYDDYKRTRQKTYTVGGKSFIKKINYSKTRPASVEDKCGTTTIANTSYGYDDTGRINSINNGNLITYEYDAYGQLVRENNKILDKSFQCVYNNIGNVESVKTYAYTPKGTALSGDYTEKTFTFNTTYPDRLINFNGNNISYNSMGCPLSYGNKSYEWKNGKLARVYRGSAEQAGSLYEDCIFKYNARGQRVSKTVIYDINPASTSDYSYRHDTTYDYDGSGRLIRQYTTEATTYEGGGINVRREFIFLYDESGIIGVMYGYNDTGLIPYYFLRNLQGDVIAIYDTNGNKVVEYAYDAWGNCTVVSATNSDLASTNPIRYRGYYYDKEIGWYYLNARYYNPEWRRFISPDDTAYLDSENVNGCNLYCYCNNDPINYADPSGHSWESFWNGVGDWFNEHWVELAIGTAFIIGGAIVTAVTCGAGTTAWAAFGSALISSAIQVGASVAIGVGVNGLVNLANGNNFFDNVGNTIASSYMLSGIAAGASQVVSGAFRTLFLKLGYTGTNTNYLGFLSPDKLYYDHAGMTILRVGARKGIKLALDLGRYGIHAHILGDLHAPIIPLLVGALEAYIADRRY